MSYTSSYARVENVLTSSSIIYGYFEIAAKEGDMAGLKGMVMG